MISPCPRKSTQSWSPTCSLAFHCLLVRTYSVLLAFVLSTSAVHTCTHSTCLVGVRALYVSRPYLHTQHMSCRRSSCLREPSIPTHTTHVLSVFVLSTSAVHTCTHNTCLVGVRAVYVSRPYLHTQHMSCRRSSSLRQPSIPALTTHVLLVFIFSTSDIHIPTHTCFVGVLSLYVGCPYLHTQHMSSISKLLFLGVRALYVSRLYLYTTHVYKYTLVCLRSYSLRQPLYLHMHVLLTFVLSVIAYVSSSYVHIQVGNVYKNQSVLLAVLLCKQFIPEHNCVYNYQSVLLTFLLSDVRTCSLSMSLSTSPFC